VSLIADGCVLTFQSTVTDYSLLITLQSLGLYLIVLLYVLLRYWTFCMLASYKCHSVILLFSDAADAVSAFGGLSTCCHGKTTDQQRADYL